ncbi:MAG: TPM domain-containing protein [Christensenellales bacterium]|jgi:hypothetical protein
MTTRFISLLAAFLLLTMAAGAYAAQPSVQDSALVLSEETARDIAELSRRLDKAAGIKAAVMTRHFLDGAAVAQYAGQALAQSEDSDNTILLLMVIGEERYAAVAGSQVQPYLEQSTLDSLLSTQFRTPFMARDYDEAAASFLLTAARVIANGAGERLSADGLFGALEQPATQIPASRPLFGADWLHDIIGEIGLDSERFPGSDNAVRRSVEGDTGWNAGKVIFTGLVLYFLFGRKKGKRGARRGCGPLGWIIGLFGFTKIFGFRK